MIIEKMKPKWTLAIDEIRKTWEKKHPGQVLPKPVPIEE